MRGRSVRASLPSPSAHTSGRRRRLLAVDARVAAAADAARALQHLPSPRLRPRPRLPPPPPARHSSFAAREQERERGCVPLRLEHAPARTRTNACHGDDGAPRPCARSTARSAHMCTCACYRIMCARRAPAAAPAGQRASAPPSAAAAGSLALAPAPARFATPHRPPDPQSLPVCSSAASASWRRTAAAPPLLARHHAGTWAGHSQPALRRAGCDKASAE